MKRYIIILLIILATGINGLSSPSTSDTSVYLITCAPGTDTYSIYGHSALRIIIPEKKSDIAYNWGVFDFSTPNFVWKFAKGRLSYMLDAGSFDSFMQIYLYEKRSVYSQEINLESSEINELIGLIKENLKPENKSYRYDFFYDDCSTRIRDLIEKVVGKKLIYPPDEIKNVPTFREKVGEYQKIYPWLKMGIDLIMGTPGDKKAFFRDRMFLPIDMQNNLSRAVINRNRKMIPLLQPAETLLEFDPPRVKQRFYSAPIFIFTLIFILIIFLSSLLKKHKLMRIMDSLIFTLFSILSLLMIFFNFFTDHQQMRNNLNIIWFNPFIIICLLCLLFRKTGQIWFRIVFILSVVFFPVMVIFPNAVNISFVPVIFILALRSSARGNFSWNPLSVDMIAGK